MSNTYNDDNDCYYDHDQYCHCYHYSPGPGGLPGPLLITHYLHTSTITVAINQQYYSIEWQYNSMTITITVAISTFVGSMWFRRTNVFHTTFTYVGPNSITYIYVGPNSIT